MSYKPSIVMITGATGDFGRAFAKRFAALGCKLVLHGRDAKKVEAMVKEYGAQAYGAVFDMCDGAAIDRGIESIPEDFKDIDLLINNAGGALGLEKLHETPVEDLENVIDVNVMSLVRVTRRVLPRMVANKRGHVINIGSIAANWPYPGGHVYCGVKAFVRQFSLAVRADLQGTGVRVTDLEPGMVETQFSLARFKGDAARAAKVYAGTTPLTPEDIAEAAVWVSTLPDHVNINTMEIMPTKQSFSAPAVERSA